MLVVLTSVQYDEGRYIADLSGKVRIADLSPISLSPGAWWRRSSDIDPQNWQLDQYFAEEL